MARRRGDLAGLAALAALGFGLYNSKKKEDGRKTESTSSAREDSLPMITSDMRKRAEEEGGNLSPGEIAAMSGPAIAPTGAASPVKTTTAAPQKTESLQKKYSGVGPKTYTRSMGATAEGRDAYEREKQAKPATRPAAPAPARKPTRDELISQIPTGGMPTVEGGERVSGSEFGRNAANTLAALGPGKLAGIGAVGMEMRGAEAARKAALAKAERSAELAKELRSSQRPTSFTSSRSTVDKNPTKSSKRFEDDEAGIEFKRGGKATSKPSAKGWGKARGARQAKYY